MDDNIHLFERGNCSTTKMDLRWPLVEVTATRRRYIADSSIGHTGTETRPRLMEAAVGNLVRKNPDRATPREGEGRS